METTLLYNNDQDLPTPLTIGVNRALANDLAQGFPRSPLVRFNRLDPRAMEWLQFEDDDDQDPPPARLLFPPV